VISGNKLVSATIENSFGSIVLNPGGAGNFPATCERTHCPCVRSEKQSLALLSQTTRHKKYLEKEHVLICIQVLKFGISMQALVDVDVLDQASNQKRVEIDRPAKELWRALFLSFVSRLQRLSD
jgi:hypothetical protein